MSTHHIHSLRAAALSLVLILLPSVLHAQRTAIGTVFVSAQAVATFSGAGGCADVGVYNAVGMWKGGISCTGRSAGVYSAGGVFQGRIGYTHIVACGDHLWRIVANHSRTLNLYGGGGVFLGIELVDPAGRWPSGSVFPFDGKNKFLYGAEAQLEFEWFFLRSVPDLALVAGGRLPVNFSSRVRKFNQEMSFGLKYNF